MDKIVILTGAGVSAESGLGTFRDEGGLWSQYDLEEVATPQGFARDPGLVLDFYNARRANSRGAAPNAAHRAIARLEADHPGDITVITQNIDDLHERAGSRNVIHMHGEIERALCARCDHRWLAPDNMTRDDACPNCGAHAARPDIVWFGEIPYHMERIAEVTGQADLFAAIGTSGQVYPAAGLVEGARRMGAATVELNREPSDVARAFDRVILGPASQVVPDWVAELLEV
ncbi:MAG: NAD-dependent deacylase [Pseudomonadota bacterium]